MLEFITKPLQNWLGRGDAAVTVPPMDGAIKPNNLLETAPLLKTHEAPDNLVIQDGKILFSSGHEVFQSSDDFTASEKIAEFSTTVLAMAVSEQGVLAVALADAGIHILNGPHHGMRVEQAGGKALGCVVAMAFKDENKLLICNGSTVNSAAMWQKDLLERETSGAVWLIDLPQGKMTLLADHLAFPYGILPDPDGKTVIVSESWKSRLIRISLDGGQVIKPVVSNLPGYPARLMPRAGNKGAWLAMFAPRSQLIELVLREKTYRRAMIKEVAPEFWIAPCLTSGKSFLEPTQGGAIKQMGILKPWAPTRSYGLVVALDQNFEPVLSFHSRADGTRHGVTSAVEFGNQVVVASKGGNALLSLATHG